MKICGRCKREHDNPRFKQCDACREYNRKSGKKWREGNYVQRPRKPKMSAAQKRANRREWYQRNAERERARTKSWMENNPEGAAGIRKRAYESRMRRRGDQERMRNRFRMEQRRALIEASSTVTFTIEMLQARMAYYHRCWICKSPRWDHVDHVKPLSKGGPHMLANLRPACAECNRRKGSTWPFPT